MIWQEQQQKDVFHQFEFVDKFNLETQNPRRDSSIPSVSAGLTVHCEVSTVHWTLSQALNRSYSKVRQLTNEEKNSKHKKQYSIQGP